MAATENRDLVFDPVDRYTPIRVLGRGAYGVVFLCEDKANNNRQVAIKKVLRVFANAIDTKRTLREIKLLKQLDHDQVIQIWDIVAPPSYAEFNDLYIVMELMQTDIHNIIYSKQEITDDHCCYFIYQVLRGLKYIHGAHILHRDLKPSNLLVNEECDVKICDFGLARVADPDQNGETSSFLTEYVATRWYRAPEIMVSWSQYTTAVDVWSVGCILAELIGRRVLFPGKDFLHQISLITDMLGTPSDEDIDQIRTDKARTYIRALPQRAKVPWDTAFPDANPVALDLLEGLLTFNPDKRLTVTEALAHPYFETYHNEADEPLPAKPASFDFEDIPLSRETLKEILFTEIFDFHPELQYEEQARQLAAGNADMFASNTGGTSAGADITPMDDGSAPAAGAADGGEPDLVSMEP